MDQEIGSCDSVLIDNLTEDTFINNLHQRFKHDQIYTYIGTFLVAVNPYKPLSIYSQDLVKSYATKGLLQLPPHIYGITSAAYQWLQDRSEDQCMILTGESCSGKTETSRLIVNFLSHISDIRRRKNQLPRQKNLSISPTCCSHSNSRTSTPKHLKYSTNSESTKKIGLIKTNSDDGGEKKKRVHEKTVEFDFSKYSSIENVMGNCSSSGLQYCPKHNIDNIRNRSSWTFDSCLKNPNCSKSNQQLQQKQQHHHHHHHHHHQYHLYHYHKNISSDQSNLSKNTNTENCLTSLPSSNIKLCENIVPITSTTTTTMSTTVTIPSPQNKQTICESCGHNKCAKTNEIVNLNKCNVFASLNEMDNNTKCICESVIYRSVGCDDDGGGVGSSSSIVAFENNGISDNGVDDPSGIDLPTYRNQQFQQTKHILRNSFRKLHSSKSHQSLDLSIGVGGADDDSLTILLNTKKIIERVAQAEVFLEALGNAYTQKNYNSSRYGKFFDIVFDFKGDVIAGHVTHYMLEKSRITSKTAGERNFHIFYQLLAGADIQLLKSLKLHRNADKYELLKHGSTTADDKNNFSDTKKSLEILGLNREEFFSIFKIIAAVIKLGNLIFIPITNIDGTEGCQISNEYEIIEIAQLLHIDAQILIRCMTRSASNNIDIDIGTELDTVNAIQLRDTLCRTLYGRLFTWIINRINDSLKSNEMLHGTNFGILDFFGFEIKENNSFEQLVINYSNEKLHQNFIQNVLKYQQDLYCSEGLEWKKLNFFDNETICDLIDRSCFGVLCILDEAHITNDQSLLVRLQQCCSGNPNFQSHEYGFQIRHYAGSVNYSINDFIAKNTDILIRNISSGLYQSKLSIVQSLFPEGNPKRCSRKPSSLATNFRTQLQSLLFLIKNRRTSYIFCIKPNEYKQSKSFELSVVQHQVRYMNLMTTISLWRNGHCFNMLHGKFFTRYKLLNVLTWPNFHHGTCVEGIAIIIRGVPLPAREFTIGIRRVFIRSPRTVYEIEEFRKSRIIDLAILIQKTFRCYSKRKYFLHLKNSQKIIASAWRTWRECRFGVPYAGQRHLWGIYRVAKEEYESIRYRKQIEWAIVVIQRQFVQWKKRQFLLTLLLQLPDNSLSPLSTDWPVASRFLTDTSTLLHIIYHRWRCYRYRKIFDQTSRNRMREKVTASIIFRDRKASYAHSVAHPFLGDYVRLRQNSQWKKMSFDSNDQYVVFADIINKIARSSGKFVPILLVISTSSMLLLDQRTLQIKYRIPATEIYRMSLSPYLDDIAVFHVKADTSSHRLMCSDTSHCMLKSDIGRKKGDFVFQTEHVLEIVTKLFLVVQNAVSKSPEIHISTEFEANFGQQTVIVTFKYSEVQEFMHCSTRVNRKGNRMEIIV